MVEKEMLQVYVVIPVRKLKNVKSRLSRFLVDELRWKFNLKMLSDVLVSVKNSRFVEKVFVVTPDMKVLRFADKFGVEGLLEKVEAGVNMAVDYAVKQSIKEKVSAILILPSDIPLIRSEDINNIVKMGLKKPSIVVSPSTRFDGTNALLLHPPNVIQTCYEQNSFFSHLVEALKNNVKVSVYCSKTVMLDVDKVEDLKEFIRFGKKTNAYRFLKENLNLKFLG